MPSSTNSPTPGRTQSDIFFTREILSNENRIFIGSILARSFGYLLVTLWLNSIRADAALWLVWLLIGVQFALYFSIYVAGYKRSVVLGLNKGLAFCLFIVLAILGRVENWEVVLIPVLVLILIALSIRNKRISDEGKAILPERNLD